MEKFMYPSPYIRITQGYMAGGHVNTYAIDEAGSDSGKDYLIAPYSGVVKQIYSQYENEVFFESDQQVLFADGTVDYATTLFVHQDNPLAYGMKIGKHYNQGDKIYNEGGRYNGKDGYYNNHCHLEFARGKYTGTGWYKNSSGIYTINNGKNPTECCFINDSYHILDTKGYPFKNIKELENQPDIYYAAHLQDTGWTDGNTHNGQVCGTTGQGRRLEALRVRLVNCGDATVYVQKYIENTKWVLDEDPINPATIIGTTGKGLKLEALNFVTKNLPKNLQLQYRIHIQNIGWTEWIKEGFTAGTTGQNLQIEAIQMKLV